MTAPKPFSSPVQHVPNELSVEFERRVENLLARWLRIYEGAGVEQTSATTDRYLAEQRVGREMGLL